MIYKEVTGRLGNQLFQYATVKAFKKRYNLPDDIILDFSKLRLLGTEKDGFCNQLKYFNIKDYKEGKIKHSIITKIITSCHKFIIYYILKNEKKIYKYESKHQIHLNKKGIYYFSFGYYNFMNSTSKDKYFYGDFESSKYFDIIKNELYEEFTPKYEPLEKNRKLYKVIFDTNSICVSIRRGDFITDNKISQKHLVCNEKYYYDAINYIKSKVQKPRFIIFSDDIEWCKKNLKLPKNTMFESGDDPIWEKLRLMYSCKHFIISNSTFSWWAQYLSKNESKIVVAPNIWKNYSYRSDNKFDICENEWVKIKIEK